MHPGEEAQLCFVSPVGLGVGVRGAEELVIMAFSVTLTP